MTKTYNINPWYDDFDDTKGYHQLLFKPEKAVQARELTQLQTILRDQIAKFGSHIFKHGSIVIPGNSFAELGVQTIKLASTTPSGIDVTTLIGKTLKQGTSGLSAIIKHAENAVGTEPATLFIAYTSSGNNGVETGTLYEFSSDTILDVYGVAVTTTVKTAATDHIGYGSLAHVNSGVYFVSGSFARVNKQTVTVSKNSIVPSASIRLQIIESVVDYNEDETLLDPAQGSYNYAAPGADRVKIELKLVSLPLTTDISDDYVELMKYESGVLVDHNRFAKYSELEKSLARRTYDESGDYRVHGFGTKVLEHKRTAFNDGVYSEGDIDKFVIRTTPGKAYIGGIETEKIAPTDIAIYKATTDGVLPIGSPNHVRSTSASIWTQYSSYIYVTAINGAANLLPSFTDQDEVLLCFSDVGTQTTIAKINVLSIDWHYGNVYKLYFRDLKLESGLQLSSVNSVYIGTNKLMTVLQSLSIYNTNAVGDGVTQIEFTKYDKVIVDGTTRGIVWYQSNGTLFVERTTGTNIMSGDGISIYRPTLVPPALGTLYNLIGTSQVRSVITVTQNGNLPVFELPRSNIKSIATNGINYITGQEFTPTFTAATSTNTYTATITATVGDSFVAPEYGSVVVMIPDFDFTSGGSLTLVNPNTLTISFDSTTDLTGLQIKVFAQVRKTNKQPRTKAILSDQVYSNNYTISTTVGVPNMISNSIDLEVIDVFRIKEVKATFTGITGVVDVTKSFKLLTGQTDYSYNNSFIELIDPSFDKTNVTNITVLFDRYSHGTGDYFAVNSYIASAQPKYVTSENKLLDLTKCLDFRSSNSTVITNTLVTANIDYFVPRIDSLYLTKSNQLVVASGTPADVPSKPAIPKDVLRLYDITVSPGSRTVNDVKLSRVKNARYTMADIHKLADRISNIEYFSTLNAIESSLLRYEVTDAVTGLNRFKSGYLVDNFDNPTTVCDFYNPLNRCSFSKRSLSAARETHDTSLDLISIDGYKNTNGMITLDYDEVSFISQNTATRTTNVNPFRTFTWEGSMTINPSSDSWVDTEDLPTIYTSKDETITVTREERVLVLYEVVVPRGTTVASSNGIMSIVPTAVSLNSALPVSPTDLQTLICNQTPTNTNWSIPGDAPLVQSLSNDHPGFVDSSLANTTLESALSDTDAQPSGNAPAATTVNESVSISTPGGDTDGDVGGATAADGESGSVGLAFGGEY